MATILRRYGLGARWYDLISGERWVYRAGREAGIALLAPRAGDVVIDLGCGTGLNFPALIDAVGPRGLVVGIDRSPDMLAMAQRRVDRQGWGDRVRLVRTDAAELDADEIRALVSAVRGADSGGADALLATYSLSVIVDREEAWRRARAGLRPGARACVVDMQPPRGFWAVLAPLARLACAAGGSDITARPWLMLARDAEPTTLRRVERKGRHLVAMAGEIR